MLSDKAIEEFRTIYIRITGEDISFEIAKLKAENFMRLMMLIQDNHK